MGKVVNVISNGKNITIQPTRLWVRAEQGTQDIVWRVTGNNDKTVEITAIEFDSAQAPITDVGPIPGSNDWKGTNDTDVGGLWKYTITLKVDGKPLTPLDPEVENGPPGDEVGDGD